MQRLMLAKRVWLLLLVAVYVVYFFGLGSFPLIGADEPRYAQVAREMFMRGDMVTPTLDGQTWFEKPALLYWVMMAGYAALGATEWAARVGSAYSGILTVLVVGWLAKRVEAAGGESVRGFGLAGAGVMASSAGLLVFSRGASFDILLTLTVTTALAFFLGAELEADARKRRWWLAAFYAAIGASLLAKGLVGVVVPFGVIATYFVLRRRWPPLSRLGVWWGLVLTVAVAATWYAPVIARHGWTFIDEFFVQHHFARYVSNKYRHPQPFYFYLPVLALLTLPWTAFLIDGLGSAVRRVDWRADDAASRLHVFALAWLVVPVAFFSLSGSKLPGYILPALPGAALLAASGVARFTRGEGGVKAMRATGALALALAAGGLVYGLRSGIVSTACVVGVALPVIGVGVFVLAWTRRRVECAASVVVVTFLTVVLMVACALPSAANRESVRELLQKAEARGYGSAPVYQLHTIERTAEFYAAGRLAYDPSGEPLKFEGAFEVADAARAKGTTVLVLVPVEYAGQLTDYPSLDAEMVADNGAVALVAVKALGTRPSSQPVQ